MEMNKKEITKLAQKKIMEGKSRQQTFEELKAEINQPIEAIAKIVRYIPTVRSREKYKGANTLLGIVLIITILFKVAAVAAFVQELGGAAALLIFVLPVVNVLLTIAVFQYKGAYYRAVTYFTVIGILNSLKYVVGKDFDPLVLVDFAVAAALIGLSLFLSNKMFSNYELKKVRYKAADGKIKIRQQIQFADEYIPSDTLDGDMTGQI